MKLWILKLLGIPLEEAEERVVILEERAAHLRKHVIAMESRLDRIEHTLDMIIKNIEENKK